MDFYIVEMKTSMVKGRLMKDTWGGIRLHCLYSTYYTTCMSIIVYGGSSEEIRREDGEHCDPLISPQHVTPRDTRHYLAGHVSPRPHTAGADWQPVALS